MKIMDPVHIKATELSCDDLEFFERLKTALYATRDLTPEGFYGQSSSTPDPRYAVAAFRKLSKPEVGVYGLACASLESQVPGMTNAALLVINAF